MPEGTPAAGGAGAAGGGAGGLDATQIDDGEGLELTPGATANGAQVPRTFKQAMDKVRTERGTAGAAGVAGAGAAGAGEGAGEGGEGAGGEGAGELESDDDFEARIAELEPDEQTSEREARTAIAAGEPDPRLLIEIPALREGEEPIRIVAEDQHMADTIRNLQRRAGSMENALRVREQAEAIRAQADESQFQVEVDPVAFAADHLNDPSDFPTLARYFLTRPGVIEALQGSKGWLSALLEAPEAVEHEAEVADAHMVKRREKVAPLVANRRFENQNARNCVRRAYEAIDAAVPAEWTDAQRDKIVSYVVRDLQELQAQERMRVTDPKRVPKIVEGVLASFGVAPGRKAAPAGGVNGRPPAKPGARTGPSGQDLVNTDKARRRAAGPGPGAGSPAAAMPKPPKGTMLQATKDAKGNVVPSAFQWLRSNLKRIVRAP